MSPESLTHYFGEKDELGLASTKVFVENHYMFLQEYASVLMGSKVGDGLRSAVEEYQNRWHVNQTAVPVGAVAFMDFLVLSARVEQSLYSTCLNQHRALTELAEKIRQLEEKVRLLSETDVIE